MSDMVFTDLGGVLGSDERPLVTLLGVAAESMTRTDMLKCFSALKVRRGSGRPYDSKSLGVDLERLAERSLVEFQGRAWVTPERAWDVLVATPRETLDRVTAALRERFPLSVTHPERARRELQLALLDRDADGVAALLAMDIGPYAREDLTRDLPEAALDHVRAGRDPRLVSVIAAEQLRTAREAMQPANGPLQALEEAAATGKTGADADLELARHLVLRGRFDAARELVDRHPDDGLALAVAGWIAAATGDLDRAAASFATSLDLLKTKKKARTKRQTGPELVVRAIAGLAVPALRDRLTRRKTSFRLEDAGGDTLGCESGLEALASFLRTGELPDDYELYSPYRDARADADAWGPLCAALAHALASTPMSSYWRERVQAAHALAVTAEQPWLASQLASVLGRVDPAGEYDAPHTSLLACFDVAPIWDTKLQRLEAKLIATPPAPAAPAPVEEEPDRRLVWMLERGWRDSIEVHPREQRRNAKGKWSKGRRVALEHLYGANPSYEYLTEADRAVCRHIRQDVSVSRGYTDYSYQLVVRAAYRDLAEHGHVYWLADPSQPVTLRDVEPSLHVTRDGKELVVRVDPPAPYAGARLEQAGPYELAVVRVSELHRSIGEIVGDTGLRVPTTAADRVERIIAAVTGKMPVHSDIGAATPDEVPADPRIVVQLSPVGEGLQVRVRVCPLGPAGPALRPGQGASSVSAQVDGKVVATTRELDAELAHTNAFVAACPAVLSGYEGATGEWEIADREVCLELVLQLAEAEDVTVQWPSGEALRVVGTASSSALRMRVAAGDSGWFDVAGDLRIDAELAIELSELLALVADSPGRFVAIAPGQFVALTERFERELDTLARLVKRGAKDRLSIHPWATAALEPLADGARDLDAVDAWRDLVRARREAASADIPVPTTLRATLRGYQREGFVWLARLAQLGAAACLADDMGLGKTLQSLSLLVHRASLGSQLVVCPTSVVGGWLDEAARFAPTLRVQVLGAGDRAALVDAAGPFDLVVTSYGLLQSEAALLASRRWETVVLDEAQAIKNPDTQRAKAARALDAGFRLALTGTPVENRLDELWSLFAFLVPGLLGSRKGFQERFARPIDEGDRAARASLRRLIRPLLLRRLKSEVLDELPEKTETQLRVELSPEEAALYEALRLRALASLSAHAEQPAGQHRMRVLAEIMRLRRACCHPRLVSEDLEPSALPEGLGSAKLEALAELVAELRDGGHRALVYSQFVDHLAVVREWLDAENVAYQYLDGSTPQRARQERVAAFQAGEGEVFLISLRAGGTGLNLTGADFVIHLDPWWNPAVEDQASDRTHRIGQERPVTVVRLVARGTIEERIVALHKRKRDLADGILAGADAAVQLDVDELVALLAE